MFQKVMELDAKVRRRELGAHHTSEANILHLIGPLFLDELRAELDACKTHKGKLFEFHKKLQALSSVRSSSRNSGPIRRRLLASLV